MKEIDEILIKQKEFYNSGKTKNVKYRIEALKKLKSEIIKQEEHIKEALKKDRTKTQVEGFTKLDLMELTRKHICSHKE